MVVDEVHVTLSEDAYIIRALKQIFCELLLMSATPLSNRYCDLKQIIKLLCWKSPMDEDEEYLDLPPSPKVLAIYRQRLQVYMEMPDRYSGIKVSLWLGKDDGMSKVYKHGLKHDFKMKFIQQIEELSIYSDFPEAELQPGRAKCNKNFVNSLNEKIRKVKAVSNIEEYVSYYDKQ